jgi:hypothetical protein
MSQLQLRVTTSANATHTHDLTELLVLPAEPAALRGFRVLSSVPRGFQPWRLCECRWA